MQTTFAAPRASATALPALSLPASVRTALLQALAALALAVADALLGLALAHAIRHVVGAGTPEPVHIALVMGLITLLCSAATDPLVTLQRCGTELTSRG